MNEANGTLPEWMWWDRGNCVVKVLRMGHFPTTVMVKLPDDKTSEIEVVELRVP